MAAKYVCPNCDAVLRPKSEIPAGKQVRCPSCRNPFTPTPAEDDKAGTFSVAAAPPPPPRPVPGFDEDDETAYAVAALPEETEEEKKARKIRYGSLRKKFPKSKRGPAIAKVARISNYIIRLGVFACIAAVLFIIYSLWPLVFSAEPLGDDRVKERWLMIGLGVLGLVYGMVVTMGAAKMHDLESYTWAMVGIIMAIPLGLGIFALMVLRDETVQKGFLETAVMLGKAPPPDEDEEDEDDDEDDDDEDDDDDYDDEDDDDYDDDE